MILPLTLLTVTTIAVIVTISALFAYVKRDPEWSREETHPSIRRMFLAVAFWQFSVGLIQVYFDQWVLSLGPFVMGVGFIVMRRYWVPAE